MKTILQQMYEAQKELNDRIAELDGGEPAAVKWMPVREMKEEEPEPVTQRAVWNEPKGELFIGGGLARAYKEAWDKYETEREARMTPEEHLAEKERAEKSPWFLKLKAQWKREDAEWAARSDAWVASLPTVMDDPPLFWNRPIFEPSFGPPPDFSKKCECGVAITGGLHSDWCPLHEERSV